MTDSELLRALADSLQGNESKHHPSSQDACLRAADALEEVMPLLYAIGQCKPGDVPADVYKAMKFPQPYYEDALVRLSEKVEVAEAKVERLDRERAQQEAEIAKLREKVDSLRTIRTGRETWLRVR